MSDATSDGGIATSEQIGRMLVGRQVTAVSVAARVALSAHALNNEGSRNNALIARQLDVVAGNEIVQSNAVSGDMLKHAFVDYLRREAERSSDASLPLCAACRRADPNRLNGDPAFQSVVATVKSDETGKVIDEVIDRCVIDDVAGLLVTQGNRNAPRHSTVQFGWELGVPERVRTGRYIHLKLVPGAPHGDGGAAGSNLGQNLFTRPASSGQYAFVAMLELNRIGRNDVTRQAVVADDARRARMQAALQALFLTVAMPDGAQTNTQLPHMQGAEGAVSFSTSTLPPVLFSPLADDFAEQMEACARAFGRSDRDLSVVRFANIGELGAILSGLADSLAPAAAQSA